MLHSFRNRNRDRNHCVNFSVDFQPICIVFEFPAKVDVVEGVDVVVLVAPTLLAITTFWPFSPAAERGNRN